MFFSLGISVQIYSVLFIIAVLPVFTGFKPFTYYISKKQYPEAIVNSDKFLKVNNGMSLIWGALFLLSAVLAHLTEGTFWTFILPVMVIAVLGTLINKKMPEYLSSRIQSKPMEFTTVRQLMDAMPYGMNKEKLAGKEFSIAYHFTGDESADYLLTVKDGQCTLVEKTAEADMKITCDGKVWLEIALGRASGTEAFINGTMRPEGDVSLIGEMEELLGKENRHQKIYCPDYHYKTAEKGAIKKIIVIDGSPRLDSKSKTRVIAKAFVSGALDAGAYAEYITLKDLNIKQCCGCYTCWAVTPGQCIIKDDMNGVIKHVSEADLVVFASPLYYFSVTGLMKNFMDRMLPMIQPYMIKDGKGHVTHPKRYDKKQYFAVVSVSGFPEVRGNFDGLLSMFRCLDKHSTEYGLMGEILLPSAETISQPIYGRKLDAVIKKCEKMGHDAVALGRIDVSDMAEIAKPIMPVDKFMEQANAYWRMMEKKQG